MQFSSRTNTSPTSVTNSADDVDQLFDKLEQVEVPVNFMEQLRARLQGLPASQRYPQYQSEQDDTEGSYQTIIHA